MAERTVRTGKTEKNVDAEWFEFVAVRIRKAARAESANWPRLAKSNLWTLPVLSSTSALTVVHFFTHKFL